MVHTTSNPAVVDKSARRCARLFPDTLPYLKVQAHRSERRAVRQALHVGNEEVVPARRVTGRDVA